jgi:uncharacterized protein (TIGR02246 family)
MVLCAGWAGATVRQGDTPKSPEGQAAPTVAAQDPGDPKADAPEPALLNPDRAVDERAIRAVSAAMIRGIEAGNAEAVASTFTEDAEIVDENGESTSGRNEIRARFARTFEESPGATLRIEVRSLRFLGQDTAIERGVATIQTAGDPESASSGPYTVIYAKRDGVWLQASVEDHPSPVATEQESNERYLQDLAWMVGDWVNEDSESVVSTRIRWDERKNFLLQEFTVSNADGSRLKGSQRIGWDPSRREIRSWIFDSEGGFGEAHWSRDDEGRWVTRAHGTRRDGSTAEATRILTPLDDHRVLWEVSDRMLDGEELPDRDSFVMVRQPPAPGSEDSSAKSRPTAKVEPAPRPDGR